MSFTRSLTHACAALCLALSSAFGAPAETSRTDPSLIECRRRFSQVARAAGVSLAAGRDPGKALRAALKYPKTFEGLAYLLFLNAAKVDSKAFQALLSFGFSKHNFVSLSEHLRGIPVSDSDRRNATQITGGLDRLFEKAPKFSGVLFRGEVRRDGAKVSRMDKVEKAFLSTSVSPETALAHASPKAQTAEETEKRNSDDHRYEWDDPYYERGMADLQQDIIKDRYGENPVRLFTVFDFRRHPTPALWMPAAYKVYNSDKLENRFTATGNVWQEDEVLLPRKLKFRTTSFSSAVDEDGIRYVFRVLEPTGAE